MILKTLEIRDKGTFIPVIAVQTMAEDEAEEYLLARAGFRQSLCVILCRLECSGTDRNASYDPHAWGGRTYPVAHEYITNHFAELENGQVIDVEFILKETDAPKVSERLADGERAAGKEGHQ